MRGNMATLGSVIDTIIPWVIVIVFVGIFYVKLREPINAVIGWFKKMFGWGKDNISGSANVITEVVYK
jgi:hypothetical protein